MTLDQSVIVLEDEWHHVAVRRRLHRIAAQYKRMTDQQKELRTLRARAAVTATLCGFERHPHIVHAAVTVQAAARGWILRRDKRIFDESVAAILRAGRALLARRRVRRTRRAIRTLQSRARGTFARRTPIGRALALVSQHRDEIRQLELLTLRLTSMMGPVA